MKPSRAVFQRIRRVSRNLFLTTILLFATMALCLLLTQIDGVEKSNDYVPMLFVLSVPRFALYRRLFLWRSGIFCRRAARQLRVYLPVFHVQLFFARVSDRHSLHAYCFCFDLYADNDDQASGAGAKRSRSRDGPQQSASRDLTRFAYAVDVDSRRKLCSDGKWR